MSEPTEPSFGINSWLEEELYQNYLHDKKNVDDTWKRVFETNGSAVAPKVPVNGANGHPPVATAPPPAATIPSEEIQPLRGVAAKIVENMTQSLTVPTATSQRVLPVKTLELKRAHMNDARAAAALGKVSYTHLISWAIVRAVAEIPNLNNAFAEQNGGPAKLIRKEVNIGIAVDVKGKDGGSSLMVPNIKNAAAMNFAQYLNAFDDVVARARNGKLQMPDFQGTTISLTNPGTVGTVASVPRLMAGQGAIIATGAMDYPAEYRTVSEASKSQLGLSKVMTVTCTYDHRIIQGAESGRFLGRLEALLSGEDRFYDDILEDLGLPVEVTLPSAAAAPAVRPAMPATGTAISKADALKESAAAFLMDAYRVRGHLVADLDPLGSKRDPQPDLDPANYGLTDDDLDLPLASQGGMTLRSLIAELRKTYCEKVAVQYTYLQFSDQVDWLRHRMEATLNHEPLDKATRVRILDHLIEAEEFEHFIHRRFLGKKRFSIEGGESSITALDEILERGGANGVTDIELGMAHRGRLSILATIVGKPLAQVISDFEEAPDASANMYGSGDVKYHLGASCVRTTTQGKPVTISMAFNPSHLEAVDPVVEGIVRAQQDRRGDKERSQILPILIHGDAAFAGQGVVAETLNLSLLEGYATGGTIHLIINNQIGFTTNPSDERSGTYSSDIARCIQAPIFHVNGDDPEAVVRVARLAFDFRQQFKRDVVIDLVCYRRLGHNETDDPTITQPVMYKQIAKHPSVITLYSGRLIQEDVLSKADVDEKKKNFVARMTEAYNLAKQNAESYELQEVQGVPLEIIKTDTAIASALAEQVVQGLTTFPAGFHLHPKMVSLIEQRKKILAGEPFQWAEGEAMAFGSLAAEGTPVRLSGQDSGRGTFSQRHATFYDYEDGHKYVPLQHIAANQAPFEVWDSFLSEYAVMGFEFGFSLADPNTLVLWEGQFGDFVNGAQIILDQFLSSAETKWGQPSGLVLLLPHGYEGQGPEHSSARIERFLQLCAENNMQVANCTTPAQYFHILRRQMRGPDGKPIRKPLIVFTPKSMLRNQKVVSRLEDLTSGYFQVVIPDPAPAANIKRILLCSGKVYYDLAEGREKRAANHVAILRLEQLYPFPQNKLQELLAQYGSATEVYWVQEEPRNMGPWRFVQENLQPLLDPTKRVLGYAGRPESASPAAGTTKRHEQEQAQVVDDAFAAAAVTRKPGRVKLVKKPKK
jgi:multifunctional 2-oxoglutarate metabolism enzyme